MSGPMAEDDIVRTHQEGAGNLRAPLLVLDPLLTFLDEHELGEGEPAISRIGDGHSNATFLIERGGARFVLRRPPRPPIPPSANDMLREARVIGAACDPSRSGGVPARREGRRPTSGRPAQAARDRALPPNAPLPPWS